MLKNEAWIYRVCTPGHTMEEFFEMYDIVQYRNHP